MTDMLIKSEIMNVNQLFDTNTYFIPKYQRNFAWEKQQCSSLWEDITQNLGKTYFLGSIIVIPDNEDSMRLEVIDGQQRLTALQIILCLIRDHWIKLGDAKFLYKGLEMHRSEVSHSLIFKLGSNPGFRFKSNNYLAEIFKSYVQEKFNSDQRKSFIKDEIEHQKYKIRAKKLIAAYQFFSDKIDQVENESKLAEIESHIIDNIKILRITAGNTTDAYTLFETLNDRGLDLAPSDLVKTYLLSKVQEHESIEEVDNLADVWDEMTDSLKGNDTTNFLRHYLLLDKPKVKKSDIFQGFKDKLTSTTDPTTPLLLVSDLIRLSELYSLITRNDVFPRKFKELDDIFGDLDSIGVDTHRVFLLALLKYYYKGSNPNLILIMKAARLTEILSFRWTICGLNAQNLENIYQDAAQTLKELNEESFEKSLNILRSKIPDDNQFIPSFSVHEVRNSKVAGYALRKIEDKINPNHTHKLRGPDALHVEHIAPKKPGISSDWKNKVKGDSPYDDVICRWGNLTLLSKGLNVPIRNYEFSRKKIDGYEKEKTIKLTLDLTNDYKSWTFNTIIERSKILAKEAANVWSESGIETKVKKKTRKVAKRKKKAKKNVKKVKKK